MTMAVEIEKNSKSLVEYITILKRRKKQMIQACIITLLLTALVLVVWPFTYRASATLLIEEQNAPSYLNQSTINDYAKQKIQITTQRIIALKNIKELVEKNETYNKEDNKNIESFIDLQKNIKTDIVSAHLIDNKTLDSTQVSIVFTLSYNHVNPTKAQKVVRELTNRYINENKFIKHKNSNIVSEFLREESASLEKTIENLENELILFKEKNKDNLPDVHQKNINNIDRVERELLENNLRLTLLNKNKNIFKSKLKNIKPYVSSISGGDKRGDNDRLEPLLSEYRNKAAVYTEQHPDLVRLKKKITRLTENSTIEIKNTNNREMDNPSFVLLDSQIKTTINEINIFEDKNKELKEKLKNMKNKVFQSPLVEKNYIALRRIYENEQMKYKKIESKLMDSELSQLLSQQHLGNKVTLVQAPSLPKNIHSPNHTGILLVGFIASIVVGLMVVVIVESLDQAIYGEKQLYEIVGTGPLISIPYIYTDKEEKNRERKKHSLLGSLFFTCAAILLCTHIYYMPLDGLYFILMQQLGVG